MEIPNNPYHDYDKDGWTENRGDCNDEDMTLIHPIRYYIDADSDGFPSRFGYVEVCSWTPPSLRRGNYIAEDDVEDFDCKDEDPLIHPEALKCVTELTMIATMKR